MYALSSTVGRPHEEDDDDERPQAPARKNSPGLSEMKQSALSHAPALAASSANDRTSATKGGGGVAAAMKVASSTARAATRGSRKPGTPGYGSTAVGAVAVPGISEETTQWISTVNEETYQDSLMNRSPQIGERQSMETTQDEPVEARCVSDEEADIEAQVQSHMKNQAKDIAEMVHRQLMTHATMAEVQPSKQDTSSLTTTPSEDDHIRQQKRKRLYLIAVGLLVTVAAIAAGVGVAVSRKDDSVEQCSFCFDGTTPPNLETNQVDGQSCAAFRESQIKLDSTDPKCVYGQVVAWERCECPPLPPPPENPKCTLCASDEAPVGEVCMDLANALVYLGQDPLASCEDLAGTFSENGCTCGEPTPLEAFRSIIESLSGDQLDDENSPQFMALNWIANEDPAHLSVKDTPIETIRTRYVAAVLYNAFEGEKWVKQCNFLSEGDICKWNLADFGIICDSDGSVETLRLCKFQRLSQLITLSKMRALRTSALFTRMYQMRII